MQLQMRLSVKKQRQTLILDVIIAYNDRQKVYTTQLRKNAGNISRVHHCYLSGTITIFLWVIFPPTEHAVFTPGDCGQITTFDQSVRSKNAITLCLLFFKTAKKLATQLQPKGFVMNLRPCELKINPVSFVQKT